MQLMALYPNEVLGINIIMGLPWGSTSLWVCHGISIIMGLPWD